jgi:hypothetical protein
VGKTYFWHQFKEQLTDKKVAYVSLFGKETISSIRTDIFLQVISTSHHHRREIDIFVQRHVDKFPPFALV